MKKITSRQNSEIVAIAQLEDPKERYKQNRFIAEGLRTFTSLLDANMSLVQLYVTENKLKNVLDLVSESAITVVTKAVMDKISCTASPSGILGVFELPQKPTWSNLSSGIVLAGVTDPGNMGTLIRTCAALNKKTIVAIEGVDPWNGKVVQASAGTIGLVNLFQCSWDDLLAHKKNLPLAALVVSEGKPIHTAELHNALLVIGSEAHGIPDKWVTSCEEKITLPMPGGTESLNAAIAGSIAMYMAWMQP